MDNSNGSSPLWRAWSELKKEKPRMRIRDAAEALRTTELQLLAAGCGVEAIRLDDKWGDIVSDLPSLGRVMALTRNDNAVHEVKGVYGNIEVGKHHILVLDNPMDLRIFPGKWRYGFAVRMETPQRTLEGLQFFDEFGQALHKIYLTDQSDRAAFESLKAKYTGRQQTEEIETLAKPEISPELPDAEVKIDALRTGWEQLRDTHDFMSLLRRCNAKREQALRLIGSAWAAPMPNDSLYTLLRTASENGTPFMTFVDSPGVVQIYTGQVKNIKRMDNWLNVLDPDFNLHIREDAIASSWLVRKPSVDGIISSLELFDARGETIAILYGKRKPGIPEDERWRELLRSLPVGEEELYA